jgi:hypothetical protein
MSLYPAHAVVLHRLDIVSAAEHVGIWLMKHSAGESLFILEPTCRSGRWCSRGSQAHAPRCSMDLWAGSESRAVLKTPEAAPNAPGCSTLCSSRRMHHHTIGTGGCKIDYLVSADAANVVSLCMLLCDRGGPFSLPAWRCPAPGADCAGLGPLCPSRCPAGEPHGALLLALKPQLPDFRGYMPEETVYLPVVPVAESGEAASPIRPVLQTLMH